MTVAIPIKVEVNSTTGDTEGLAQFQTGEAIGLSHGGTGGVTASAAKTNLGLNTVATTGDYSDLSNKPTVNINTYTVSSAAVLWTITHNKNTTKYRANLFETNGDQFIAKIETIDANSFKVYLSESITVYVEVMFDGEVLLP